MDTISMIVPCYNEQASLPEFYEEICKVSARMPEVQFEYIFVDDGSKDQTLALLKKFASQDQRIQYISFSRNFGKEAALYAGLEYSSGDYVTMLDADMQDPPDLVLDMYAAIKEENYDCVAARRITRSGEPPIRSFFAKAFYHLMNRISKIEVVDGARDFRMMTRKMINAILKIKEYNRFSKGIFAWVGFKTKWVEYVHAERNEGESKWSLTSLFFYAVQGIVSFSVFPLAIASILGFFFCIVAFFLIFIIIVRTLVWGDPTVGWPSMACFILFMFGIQLFCIGILGQYVSNIYLESKKRPIYIMQETNLSERLTNEGE